MATRTMTSGRMTRSPLLLVQGGVVAHEADAADVDKDEDDDT